MQNMALDNGVNMAVDFVADATGGKGIVSRRGGGKFRHLSTRNLWTQKTVQNNVFTSRKTLGDNHVADLGTKHLEEPKLKLFLAMMGGHASEGRSELALRAAV